MIVAMLPLASCIKNDLMYPDIQACITTFSVEGQTRTTIFSSQQKVEVTVPTGTDVTALKITGFAITDGATVTTNFPAVGETVNLTDTLRVTLHLYRDYEWKIYAVKSDEGVDTKPQLYNMSFDEWTLDGKLGTCMERMLQMLRRMYGEQPIKGPASWARARLLLKRLLSQ